MIHPPARGRNFDPFARADHYPYYPYSRAALEACPKCDYLTRFGMEGPRFDIIVEHHARHRQGLCCNDPEEAVA